MKENRIVKTLHIRPFFFMVASEFFSQFSMNLFNFALLIIVFSISNSSSAVSGVVLSFTIPSMLFGILAGVLVDRWNKRSVLYLTNILRALIVFPLVFFYQNLWLVYLSTFGVSFITQFFIPAETPIIPLLVSRELLMPANALFGIGIYASMFLAYALSGPILYLLGQRDIFLLLTILFLAAGVFAYLIKVKKPMENTEKKSVKVEVLSFKAEVQEVLSLISKTKALFHALFSLTLIQVLVLIFAVVGPGYAEHVLRIKVESFPIVFVTPAIIGVALGAFVIGSFFHERSRSMLTKFGLFLIGVSTLLLPYGSRVESRTIVHLINNYLPHILRINVLHIMVLLAFILGFATAFVFVPANTILQEETSDKSRGKIYGVLNSLVGLMSIIPVVVVGGLADLIGVSAVITGVGTLILVIAILRIFVTD